MKPEPLPRSTAEAKEHLRDRLKKLRSQVPPALAELASTGIWNVLKNTPEFRKAKGIGAFASVPAEINTLPILEGIMEAKKHLYLPKVVKNKTHFDFYPVTDLKNMAPGAFGILEPTTGKAADWDELDMVLVPGLAFDDKGGRLGFGKGYYDRVLPLLKKSTLIVGVGYSFQLVEAVPVTMDDVLMKALLCESGFIYCVK